MPRLWRPGSIELCYQPDAENFVLLGSCSKPLFDRGEHPYETGIIEIPARSAILRTKLESIEGVVLRGQVDPVRKSHVVLRMHKGLRFNPIVISIDAAGRVALLQGDTRLAAAREVGLGSLMVSWVLL